MAFPTETVYGLGCISSSQKAFEKLIKVKERTPDKPFTLMCSSIEEASRFCNLNQKQIRVMKAFMPGQITVLLSPKEELPYRLCLGSKTIGIRIPDSEYVLTLIKEVGEPLLVPSANKTNQPTGTCFEDVENVFVDEIEGIVEGQCSSLLASTIVDLSQDEVKLIRQGTVPLTDIIKVWEE